MATHDEITSEMQSMLAQRVYLRDAMKWRRLWEQAPHKLPEHVKEAASDIGHDMLLDAGFYMDDDVEETATSLLTMFEIGFRYGAAFQAEPENDPNYTGDEVPGFAWVNGQRVILSEGVPPYVFDLLFDQAAEAMVEWLESTVDVKRTYNRGVADGYITALENVLSIDEAPACQLIAGEALRRYKKRQQ